MSEEDVIPCCWVICAISCDCNGSVGVAAGVFCDAELNVTDSQGKIVFDVEPGRHWIRIHKDGYVDAEFEHVFTGERPDIVVRLRRIP